MEPYSLWSESAAWRWLVSLAVLCTACVFIGSPWQTRNSQQAAQVSQFDLTQVVKMAQRPGGGTTLGNIQLTIGAPNQSDVIGQNVGLASSQGVQAAAAQRTTTNAPPVRSTVVWRNDGAAISGAGLIAAYCCAGAFSTIKASKEVSSGRHYWELTLSVRTGEQHPDSWTIAGVTTDDTPPPTGGRIARPLGIGRGSETNTVSVMERGSQRNYVNGDVFMFALDANKGIVYYGVNGRWQNGAPGEQGGATFASSRGRYTPFVNVSSPRNSPEGDRWIANFGGSNFKYPIPAGYGAYGTGVSVSLQPAPGGTGEVAGSAPVVNRLFEDEITVGGQPVPLPKGSWQVLASFSGAAGGPGDSVVLGKILYGRVKGIVAINGYAAAAPAGGSPPFAACDRTDYVFVSRKLNEGQGRQQCWWINHASQIDQQPLFRAANAVMAQKGAALPPLLINVGFRRANPNGFVTVFYYFNPEDDGISSQPVPWNASEWHKDRIAADQRRVRYIDGLRIWGEEWAPIFYAMRN